MVVAVSSRYRITTFQQTLLFLLAEGVNVDVRGGLGQAGSLDFRDILPVLRHQLSPQTQTVASALLP